MSIVGIVYGDGHLSPPKAGSVSPKSGETRDQTYGNYYILPQGLKGLDQPRVASPPRLPHTYPSLLSPKVALDYFASLPLKRLRVPRVFLCLIHLENARMSGQHGVQKVVQ